MTQVREWFLNSAICVCVWTETIKGAEEKESEEDSELQGERGPRERSNGGPKTAPELQWLPEPAPIRSVPEL